MIETDNRSLIDEALIRDVTDRIVARFHPEKIILFGSHARGDAGPDSDLDLIVVMDTEQPFLERIVQIHALFGLRRWPLDVVVYTPAEFSRGLATIGQLPAMVASEMKVLHAIR